MSSRTHLIRAAGLAAATALVAAGCGSSSAASSSSGASSSSPASTSTPSSAAAAPLSHTTHVSITNFAYAPATLTVARGAQVTWTNHDSTAHTATVSGGFDTGAIQPGKSASVRLTKPGTYHYVCSFHPFMHGTIVVR